MSLFSRRKRQYRDAAAGLYARIVRQSRHPELYLELGVPDTVEGRFEMIVLHLFALTHRLVRASDGDADFARAVTEAFVADMDANLREMGVGDLSVGKKVRTLYAVYGRRVAAYDVAISGNAGSGAEASREDALEAAIARNVYAGNGPRDAPGRMAGYVRRMVAALAAAPAEAIRRSVFEFSDPDGVGSEGDQP